MAAGSEIDNLMTGLKRASEWSILDDLGPLLGRRRPPTLLNVHKGPPLHTRKMSEITSLQAGPERVSEWSISDDLGPLQGWMRPTTLLEVRNRLEAGLV